MALTGTCWAAAGVLDNSFSGDGRLTVDFGSRFDYGDAVAVQGDGKLVVAGVRKRSSAGAAFAVARINTDGTLDGSFSGDGRQLVDFRDRREDEAEAVAIQPNGKIVVAGDSNYRGAIARLNANGTLDTSFSKDGRAPAGGFDITGIGLQRDGKIVVAGTAGLDVERFAVARLTRSGRLDQTFSHDGVRKVGFRNRYGQEEGFNFAQGVALQPNGSIVVSGTTFETGLGNEFALTRLRPDGSMDRRFGKRGRVKLRFGNAREELGGALAIQPDGRIVVGGAVARHTDDCLLAAFRIRRDGRLDKSFSKNGKQTVDFGGRAYVDDCGAYSVAIQGDGRIVMVGETPSRPRHGNDFAVARFLPNGRIDDQFSGNGRAAIGFENGNRQDWSSGVAIQPDGGIVAAGVSNQPGGRDFALARLTSK